MMRVRGRLAALVLPVILLLPRPAAAGSRGGLQAELEALAARARPATFAIAVVDPQTGESWGVNAGRAYPMMSVFKAPLAATVLDQVDHGRLALADPEVLTRADFSTGWSGIRDAFVGERMTFTVQQLLDAAVSRSDNTAADFLVRLVGGPGVVTAYLRAHGIGGIRVDLTERQIDQVFKAVGPDDHPPAGETEAAMAARRARGYAAFLADPRNTAEPLAATQFLRELRAGRLLSAASSAELLRLMRNQLRPARLRLGLPPGVQIADKSGSSGSWAGGYAAYNDIAVLTWPDGHAVLVAGFLLDSHLPEAGRDGLFADLARVVTADLAP